MFETEPFRIVHDIKVEPKDNSYNAEENNDICIHKVKSEHIYENAISIIEDDIVTEENNPFESIVNTSNNLDAITTNMFGFSESNSSNKKMLAQSSNVEENPILPVHIINIKSEYIENHCDDQNDFKIINSETVSVETENRLENGTSLYLDQNKTETYEIQNRSIKLVENPPINSSLLLSSDLSVSDKSIRIESVSHLVTEESLELKNSEPNSSPSELENKLSVQDQPIIIGVSSSVVQSSDDSNYLDHQSEKLNNIQTKEMENIEAESSSDDFNSLESEPEYFCVDSSPKVDNLKMTFRKSSTEKLHEAKLHLQNYLCHVETQLKDPPESDLTGPNQEQVENNKYAIDLKPLEAGTTTTNSELVLKRESLKITLPKVSILRRKYFKSKNHKLKLKLLREALQIKRKKHESKIKKLAISSSFSENPKHTQVEINTSETQLSSKTGDSTTSLFEKSLGPESTKMLLLSAVEPPRKGLSRDCLELEHGNIVADGELVKNESSQQDAKNIFQNEFSPVEDKTRNSNFRGYKRKPRRAKRRFSAGAVKADLSTNETKSEPESDLKHFKNSSITRKKSNNLRIDINKKFWEPKSVKRRHSIGGIMPNPIAEDLPDEDMLNLQPKDSPEKKICDTEKDCIMYDDLCGDKLSKFNADEKVKEDNNLGIVKNKNEFKNFEETTKRNVTLADVEHIENNTKKLKLPTSNSLLTSKLNTFKVDTVESSNKCEMLKAEDQISTNFNLGKDDLKADKTKKDMKFKRKFKRKRGFYASLKLKKALIRDGNEIMNCEVKVNIEEKESNTVKNEYQEHSATPTFCATGYSNQASKDKSDCQNVKIYSDDTSDMFNYTECESITNSHTSKDKNCCSEISDEIPKNFDTKKCENERKVITESPNNIAERTSKCSTEQDMLKLCTDIVSTNGSDELNIDPTELFRNEDPENLECFDEQEPLCSDKIPISANCEEPKDFSKPNENFEDVHTIQFGDKNPESLNLNKLDIYKMRKKNENNSENASCSSNSIQFQNKNSDGSDSTKFTDVNMMRKEKENTFPENANCQSRKLLDEDDTELFQFSNSKSIVTNLIHSNNVECMNDIESDQTSEFESEIEQCEKVLNSMSASPEIQGSENPNTDLEFNGDFLEIKELELDLKCTEEIPNRDAETNLNYTEFSSFENNSEYFNPTHILDPGRDEIVPSNSEIKLNLNSTKDTLSLTEPNIYKQKINANISINPLLHNIPHGLQIFPVSPRENVIPEQKSQSFEAPGLQKQQFGLFDVIPASPSEATFVFPNENSKHGNNNTTLSSKLCHDPVSTKILDVSLGSSSKSCATSIVLPVKRAVFDIDNETSSNKPCAKRSKIMQSTNEVHNICTPAAFSQTSDSHNDSSDSDIEIVFCDVVQNTDDCIIMYVKKPIVEVILD